MTHASVPEDQRKVSEDHGQLGASICGSGRP
jgi:hypothetical protein